jgi:AraC family transcriptional regulator
MNMAMSYIEENLNKSIDVEKISQIACCSEYQFKRMFSYLTGTSLGEYIRNRKLSIAAILLRNKKNKVIDIAMQFGYESPDSFTKAFQSFHGMTPSQARSNMSGIKTFTPIVFQLKIKGGNMLNYRIVEKESFNIIGVSGRIPLIYNGPNPHTANVWKKLTQRDILVLLGYSKIEPSGMLTVYTNYEDKKTEGTELDLYVGIAADKSVKPYCDHFDILNVEASTWAVFTTIETNRYETQDTWSRIYSEWLATSNFELKEGPEILWNESYETEKPNRKTEIWIPVREKSKK